MKELNTTQGKKKNYVFVFFSYLLSYPFAS